MGRFFVSKICNPTVSHQVSENFLQHFIIFICSLLNTLIMYRNGKLHSLWEYNAAITTHHIEKKLQIKVVQN